MHIVEVQSLKICERKTYVMEVYFHVQMWLVPNDIGTEDENLTTDITFCRTVTVALLCWILVTVSGTNLFVTVPVQLQKFCSYVLLRTLTILNYYFSLI